MNALCRYCGGTGLVKCADVYRDQRTGKASAIWELARTVVCRCRYKEAA